MPLQALQSGTPSSPQMARPLHSVQAVVQMMQHHFSETHGQLQFLIEPKIDGAGHWRPCCELSCVSLRILTLAPLALQENGSRYTCWGGIASITGRAGELLVGHRGHRASWPACVVHTMLLLTLCRSFLAGALTMD